MYGTTLHYEIQIAQVGTMRASKVAPEGRIRAKKMNRSHLLCILGCSIAFLITSCSNGSTTSTMGSNNEEKVEEQTVSVSSSIFDNWFHEFQEENPHWTRTTEGQKALVDAFKKEMISNLDFAKSICMKKVFTSDCITSYDREDGEHGGIWAFVMKFPVKLKNPLYNGQDEVELACEIISTIPATSPHDKPYTDDANYSNTFDSYHEINYSGTLNLGTYIVTKKTN